MLAMRGVLAVSTPPPLAPESRPDYDQLIARTPVSDDVEFEPGIVGGVSGWWCRPRENIANAAILYLHGGAYVLGSATAYRNFAGQIAARAGTPLFVADYALAPERSFPAAFEDASAALNGLAASGFERIALCGDSAGGGLALALHLQQPGRSIGAAAISPWCDLSLVGESMTNRADADPLLSREALQQAATLYLGATDPRNPRASVLFADARDFPPVRVHVGDDEVLLDDALQFHALAERNGAACDVHVWKGMIHVFPANLAMLKAAGEALDDIGAFLRSQLGRS